MSRPAARYFIIATACVLPISLIASDELNQRLKRIFDSPAFAVKSFGQARWIRDGAAFTMVEDSPSTTGASDIVEYDTRTGKRTILVPASQLKPPGAQKAMRIEDYTWDKDLNRVLIFTESKKTWRTNSRGDYWLLDRAKNTLKKLGGNAPASSLLFAKFSPDGARVAYVRANNLYVEDLATGAIRALTSDGSETLVNGTSDWVYEEELNLRDGFRWSPDGREIAFWQFDSSGVEQFTLINDTDSLYPKVTRIPYPKVGTKNSAVRVGVVSVEGGEPRWMDIPGDPRENYIFRMDWVGSEGELVIGQLNRKQNTATVFLASASTRAAKVVYGDSDDAWVDVPEGTGAGLRIDGFDWLEGSRGFLWLSESDGWRRPYVVSLNGKPPVAMTSWAADVINLRGIDPGGKWAYFVASPENATQRYLYRLPLDRASGPVRVTPADQPGAHSYRISPDCKWAFHTYSRFDRPPVTELISLPEHKRVRMLEANATLQANAAASLNPPVEFVQVPVGEGVTLDGWLLKPRSFDPAKKYPIIIHVYGEPAGTTVLDGWMGSLTLFHRALADDGYLVASFDNRGTPAPKGRAWRKAVYGAVGVLSTKDQAEALLALAKERPYVDLGRVAVWGWSGGGTNTLNLMFRAPDLYRVGVAVAPVPDQKLYDTIYQERYMGLPDENAEGYRTGSAINFADGLRGKLLIVHGSGDDNVHFQGTERLVNRLIELGRPFDLMVYPNRTHSISEGQGTSLHVYCLIARYLEEHLPAGAQ